MLETAASLIDALKALVGTITGRIAQRFAVRDTRRIVYGDMAYNLPILLETALVLQQKRCDYDLRRLRTENENREPAFSLLKEVSTLRKVCDKLRDLCNVSHHAIDRFPSELGTTLEYFDNRIVNGELDKRLLLRFADADTKQRIRHVTMSRPPR